MNFKSSLKFIIKKIPFFYSSLRFRRIKRGLAVWSESDQLMYSFYSQFIKKGDVCFDIGANMGNRTKIFYKLGAKVIAVDPQPICSIPLKMAYKKINDVIVIPKAIGEKEGDFDMMVSDLITISTLSKEWIDSIKKSGRAKNYTWGKIKKVKVITLDKLIEKFGIPSFIKIDVEGYEYEVLKGLSQPIKNLSFEFTPEYLSSTISCLKYLDQLGNYSFNYSFGESMQLYTDNWNNSKYIIDELSLINDMNTYGDVYAHFNDN